MSSVDGQHEVMIVYVLYYTENASAIASKNTQQYILNPKQTLCTIPNCDVQIKMKGKDLLLKYMTR